ncbi:Uncharacterised protein [uncultured archaeon]|nr:Uncharacterised protein [uncultured archaeon]
MRTEKNLYGPTLLTVVCHADHSFILHEISDRAEEVETRDEEIHGYHAGGDVDVALRHSKLYILRETWTKHPSGNKCRFAREDN